MNGGYDPEALMQQYKDWEGQQWQPPTWGQPPATVDRTQYPGFYPYPSPQQAPASAAAHGWGLPPTAATGKWTMPIGGAPPTSTYAQTTQIPLPSPFPFSPRIESHDPNIPVPGTYINVPSIPTVGEAPTLSATQDPFTSFTPVWEATPETWKNPPSFLEKVIGESGPFTPEARKYLQQFEMRIEEPGQMGGGGGWLPWADAIHLETSQPEAMIHELTHVWWEEKRQDRDLRQAFVEAMIRYADESQQHETKTPLEQLVHIYVYGDPNDPGFSEGMKTSAKGSMGYTDTEPFSINGNYWNDWEMYAGLASGCRGDIRQLPSYLQQFYEGLFNVLPPESPGYAFEGAYSQFESGADPQGWKRWNMGKNIMPATTSRQIPQTEWGYSSLWPEEKALADQRRRDSAERKQP